MSRLHNPWASIVVVLLIGCEFPDDPVRLTDVMMDSSTGSTLHWPTGEEELELERADVLVNATATRRLDCVTPLELDVLFIGNSYTFTLNLPEMVARLGSEAGVTIHASALTRRNARLEYHLAQAITTETITEHAWDFVVLQGHSLDPIDNLDDFLAAGEALVDTIEQSGARPLLYETWAYKEGEATYETDPDTGGTPAAMQQLIREGYRSLAKSTGAPIAPVGDIWKRTLADHPTIELFDPDFQHPNLNGVYLTANVFFSVLTRMTPMGHVGVPPEGISNEDAVALQAEAARAIHWKCRPKRNSGRIDRR